MSLTTINVNGVDYEVEGEAMLIEALRGPIGALSVKVGCDDSTCGTCMVVANGRPIKACNRPASGFAGQTILTTEGLSDREKAVYAHAYAATGAVQCGFCTPGMVMASKALLDKSPEPSRDDIAKALRTDICRCTGYRQIVDAVALAGELLRSGAELPVTVDRMRVSDDAPRPDAAAKVLGTGLFTDDVRLPGMVFAKALRSPTPRGLLKGLDVSKAMAHPDCLAVLTAADVPENKIGHIVNDWDVMIPVGEHTRYVGDAIALVASTDEHTLDEILALIEVDYEALEPVTSPQMALRPDAPLVHDSGNILDIEHVKRGNPDAAIRAAAYKVTRKFKTPWQEHAFMEPECAVAEPDGDGVRMYTSGQSVYDEQHEIARMLKLPVEQVRSTSMLVGGGFGGKEDMSVQHHAALMAWHLKKPVKVKFSRSESFAYHVKRHPMDMEFTVACDDKGKLTAVKVVILSDTGAYASLGGPVLQRACTHAAGPYVVPNFECLGMALYTNNPVCGAFRGFGVVQSQFGMESCMNELAELVGLDAWEMRYQNVVRPGDTLPNGQIADDSTGIVQVLEDVKGEFYANPKAGLAIGHKNTGVGMGLPDIGRCILSVESGRVHIRTSAACMGQGIEQVVTHVLCETVPDLRLDQIVYEQPDTSRTPDSGTSTGSRQTLFSGEATRLAAMQLRDALAGAGGHLATLEGQEWFGEFAPETDPINTTKANPVSHVGYSYGAQIVTLAPNGEVARVLAVYDVGTVMNMQAAVGQIEGGVMMGLGYGLTEEFVVEDGVPKTRYGQLGLIRANKMPEVEVRFVTGPGTLPYAYGAKGMGEICLIPTAPAAAEAYYQVDGKRRYALPLRGTAYKKD